MWIVVQKCILMLYDYSYNIMVPYHIDVGCYFNISDQTLHSLAFSWLGTSGSLPTLCRSRVSFLQQSLSSPGILINLFAWHVQTILPVCSQFHSEAFCLYSLCERPLHLWHVYESRSMFLRNNIRVASILFNISTLSVHASTRYNNVRHTLHFSNLYLN